MGQTVRSFWTREKSDDDISEDGSYLTSCPPFRLMLPFRLLRSTNTRPTLVSRQWCFATYGLPSSSSWIWSFQKIVISFFRFFAKLFNHQVLKIFILNFLLKLCSNPILSYCDFCELVESGVTCINATKCSICRMNRQLSCFECSRPFYVCLCMLICRRAFSLWCRWSWAFRGIVGFVCVSYTCQIRTCNTSMGEFTEKNYFWIMFLTYFNCSFVIFFLI